MPRCFLAVVMPMLLAGSFPAAAVDGVIELNDARAVAGGVTPGDLPGYPVTIDQPGSYRLTGDLAVSGTNVDVVQISASNVALDLNGFTVRCLFVLGNACAGQGSGVGIKLTAQPENVSIRNGTVRDMASDGIQCMSECDLIELTDLRLIANGGNGADVEGGVVRRCVARGNGNSGLANSYGVVDSAATGNAEVGISGTGTIVGNRSAGNRIGISTSSALVSQNYVVGNSEQGIVAASGNVTQNHVQNNGGAAIDGSSASVTYSQNVLTGNGGAEVQVTGTATDLGGNFCGSDTTCP